MLASKPFPGLCVAVLGGAAPLPWGARGSTPRQGGPGRAGGLTLPSAQDCLRAIGSFLRTHRHVTSALTGAGLAAMVRPRPVPPSSPAPPSPHPRGKAGAGQPWTELCTGLAPTPGSQAGRRGFPPFSLPQTAGTLGRPRSPPSCWRRSRCPPGVRHAAQLLPLARHPRGPQLAPQGRLRPEPTVGPAPAPGSTPAPREGLWGGRQTHTLSTLPRAQGAPLLAPRPHKTGPHKCHLHWHREALGQDLRPWDPRAPHAQGAGRSRAQWPRSPS